MLVPCAKMFNVALLESKNMKPIQTLPWGLVNKFCNTQLTDANIVRQYIHLISLYGIIVKIYC